MKLILYIKEDKLHFVLEMLRNFKFVNNVETIEEESSTKQEILDNIKEAVQELNLIKKGKLKARNAEDLINEL